MKNKVCNFSGITELLALNVGEMCVCVCIFFITLVTSKIARKSRYVLFVNARTVEMVGMIDL